MSIFMKKSIVTILVGLSIHLMHAANITWSGAGSDFNWNNATNWVGGVLPTENDVAVFSQTSSCTINERVLIKGLELRSTYNGQISVKSNASVFIGFDGLLMQGGTLNIMQGSVYILGSWEVSGGNYEQSTSEGALYFGQDAFDALGMANTCVSLSELKENWYGSRSFDELGNVISEGRVYLDEWNRPFQSQSRNFEYDNILVQQTFYDEYGAASVATLPAPVQTSCLTKQNNFVQASDGTLYDADDLTKDKERFYWTDILQQTDGLNITYSWTRESADVSVYKKVVGQEELILFYSGDLSSMPIPLSYDAEVEFYRFESLALFVMGYLVPGASRGTSVYGVKKAQPTFDFKPSSVDNTVPNSLGWFYSENNNLAGQEFIDVSTVPFYSVDNNVHVLGGTQSYGKPGEELTLGSKHELQVTSFPITNELDHYLTLREEVFEGYTFNPAVMKTASFAHKTIVKDENGIEKVSFTSNAGQLLASAQVNEGAAPTQVIANIRRRSKYYIHPDDLIAVLNSGTLLKCEIIGGSFPFSICSGPQFSNKIRGYPDQIVLNSNNDFAGRYFESNQWFKFKITMDEQVAGQSFSVPKSYVFESQLEQLDSDVPVTYDFHIDKDGTQFDLGETYNGLFFTLTNLKNGKETLVEESTFPLTLQQGSYRLEVTESPVFMGDLTLSYNSYYSDFDYYFYDEAGNLVTQIEPNGVDLTVNTLPNTFIETFEHNSFGQVINTTSEDEGNLTQIYSTDGRLRFTQNAEQKLKGSGYFNYYHYDTQGNLIEVGSYESTSSYQFQNWETYTTSPATNSVYAILDDMETNPLVAVYKKEYTQYTYNTAEIINGSQQTYTLGGRSKSDYYEDHNTLVSSTWFSYDDRGRLSWSISRYEALGDYKKIAYEYSAQGLLKTTKFQEGKSDAFYHHYKYDANLALKSVKTSKDGNSNTALLQASYTYDMLGQLTRKEIGDHTQGLDYVYNINGWLKSINHPDLNQDPGQDGQGVSAFYADVFGEQLNYYAGDYKRNAPNLEWHNLQVDGSGSENGLYNGTIKSMAWDTRIDDQGGLQYNGKASTYHFVYDAYYELIEARFGEFDPSVSGVVNETTGSNKSIQYGNGEYDLNKVVYDGQGNIERIIRSMENGLGTTALHNLEYEYEGEALGQKNNNRLSKIYTVNEATNTNLTRTASFREYGYNALGETTYEKDETGQGKFTEYNAYGQVSKIYAQANKVDLRLEYIYNESGHRIAKKHYVSGQVRETWYYRDATGNVIQVWEKELAENSLSLTETPIYGMGRLGSLMNQNETIEEYIYEIKDHLGNVRAEIYRDAATVEDLVLRYTDYYPFGLSRYQGGNGTQRHGYQGEFTENDPESFASGVNFMLRTYDPAVARWSAPDPYAQYHSPYLAMGNDPVNGVDPDGGYYAMSQGGGGGARPTGGGINGGRGKCSGSCSYGSNAKAKAKAAKKAAAAAAKIRINSNISASNSGSTTGNMGAQGSQTSTSGSVNNNGGQPISGVQQSGAHGSNSFGSQGANGGFNLDTDPTSQSFTRDDGTTYNKVVPLSDKLESYNFENSTNYTMEEALALKARNESLNGLLVITGKDAWANALTPEEYDQMMRNFHMEMALMNQLPAVDGITPVQIEFEAILLFSTIGGSSVVKGSIQSATPKLLNSASIKFTTESIGHILVRHGANSAAQSAGKFALGTTRSQLKNMILTTVQRGISRANTAGRAGSIVEYNFGRIIGVNANGRLTSKVRVILNTAGELITSYPY